MRYLVLPALAVWLSIAGAYQKPKKPPDVEVIETKARREDGKILVDGRVRVTAEKPLHGLVIVFDLVSPENGVLTSLNAEVEPDLIERGQERTYHSVTAEQVRAVKIKIRAFDSGEKELRVSNTGPFPIE